MDTDKEEKRFRELFSELRRGDEGEAPGFDRAWEAAVVESRQPRRHAPLILRVAAVVALMAAGVVVVTIIGHHHRGQTLVRQVPPIAPPALSQPNDGQTIVWISDSSISEWQSPTSFLLDFSADESTSSRPTTNPSSGAVQHL